MSTQGDPPGGPPKDPSTSEPAPPTWDTESTTGSATPPLSDTTTGSATPAAGGPGTTTGSATPAPVVIPEITAKSPAASFTSGTSSQSFLEAAPATEESLLPTTYDENALRDAVGARRKKRRDPVVEPEPLDEDGLPDDTKWSRKTIAVIAVSTMVGLGITALVLLGRVNSQRFVLACKTSQAVAEQGRAFPPWGSAPLLGAEWKPVALPPNANCAPRELEDKSQLEGVFLDLLLERSSTTLTARNFLDAPADGKESPLELVSLQLEQALLLSRSPARGDQRKQVERLQGDVQYWRASLRLRDATTAMAEASRQFDQAALARPMHVSDAAAWAEFLRRLTDELKAGPNGAPVGFPPAPTTERPTTAPTGTALPVEPPAAGSDEAPPPMPDAGVPTGGVLL